MPTDMMELDVMLARDPEAADGLIAKENNIKFSATGIMPTGRLKVAQIRDCININTL